MEWIVIPLCSLVLILAIIFLHKFGDTDGIYRKRIKHVFIDNRKMVSVSPVKLPYSIELEEPSGPGLLSLMIKGEKKCIVTSYVCVNTKELQRVVVEKMCSPSRTLVDVLDLISVWVSQPTSITFDNGLYRHQFSFLSLPPDVQEQVKA